MSEGSTPRGGSLQHPAVTKSHCCITSGHGILVPSSLSTTLSQALHPRNESSTAEICDSITLVICAVVPSGTTLSHCILQWHIFNPSTEHRLLLLFSDPFGCCQSSGATGKPVPAARNVDLLNSQNATPCHRNTPTLGRFAWLYGI